MNESRIYQLVDLLERQSKGDVSAVNRLRHLEISFAECPCVYHLYQQWRGAFSFAPGCSAALQPLLELARKVQSWRQRDALAMYAQPEWQELIKLRGPVDVVQVNVCLDCKREYSLMGISGFLDIAGLVCRQCGNVLFRSFHDESEIPPCSCGGSYPSVTDIGCPWCDSTNGQLVRELSPFEYFHRHTYSQQN